MTAKSSRVSVSALGAEHKPQLPARTQAAPLTRAALINHRRRPPKSQAVQVMGTRLFDRLPLAHTNKRRAP